MHTISFFKSSWNETQNKTIQKSRMRMNFFWTQLYQMQNNFFRFFFLSSKACKFQFVLIKKMFQTKIIKRMNYLKIKSVLIVIQFRHVRDKSIKIKWNWDEDKKLNKKKQKIFTYYVGILKLKIFSFFYSR